MLSQLTCEVRYQSIRKTFRCEDKMKIKLLFVSMVFSLFDFAMFANDYTNRDFVLVEGGSYYTKSMNGFRDELPAQCLTVNSFYICIHEVTQLEYLDIMFENHSYFEGDFRPVETISWFDAIEYCMRRSLAEGLTPCYRGSREKGYTCDFSANGYRLPTEAEWECAARGGINRFFETYFSGSDSLERVGWNGCDTTQEVMSKAPNELGIYDMSGNVWEWCWSLHNMEIETVSDTIQYIPANITERMTRGGAYCSFVSDCFVEDYGLAFPATDARSGIGFRVVRSYSKR